MKFKFVLQLIFISFFGFNFSFAQNIVNVRAVPFEPIRPLIISTSSLSSTSLKVYKLPKVGVRTKFSDANFSIFPERINNTLKDRKTLIVSTKWQTACLYDKDGQKHIVTKADMIATTTTQAFVGKPLCFQTATGKKEIPTELGLYNIQTKYGKDYKSTLYTNEGDTPDENNLGAPMPYAMHFGRIIGQNETGKLIYDFSDGSAIHEKQTFNKYGLLPFVSHGCIAVEKGMGQTLQHIMSYGDLVLVMNENIPNKISEMISINK